ncbi:hypothetical protein M8C21_020630 [Ambrosia artemisiifolia]|uniref:Uncharacterized protein n=1 Tax=Ambrosia artemisiifolia TaxID=4212 RepID=A0AAD5D4J3_AMBAR|nr:hypothetical protein M8C21_020630 [Ambrosia artemisiifolia]
MTTYFFSQSAWPPIPFGLHTVVTSERDVLPIPFSLSERQSSTVPPKHRAIQNQSKVDWSGANSSTIYVSHLWGFIKGVTEIPFNYPQIDYKNKGFCGSG